MTVAVAPVWTPSQQAALDAVAEWHESRDPDRQVFRLFGYAGTGKTTLARACAKGVGGLVLYGCFTGKAALVLRSKGCLTAATIHSLIYTPFEKSQLNLHDLKRTYADLLAEEPKMRTVDVEPKVRLAWEAKCRELAKKIAVEEKSLRQPAFMLKESSEVADASLVVIDEVSMVGREMGEDLLSFGAPVLVIGDPAQLPPIADGGYFTEDEPDVMLTEVHRQAADSPVIALATRVRRGETSLPLGQYGESAVVPKGTLSVEEIAKRFEIVLCGKNSTRHAVNRRIRTEVLGRTSPYPEVGERLVCLRNNHPKGLLNGSLWTVAEVSDDDADRLTLVLRGDEGGEVVSEAHKHHFDGREIPLYDRRKADEFDFGYALTVHKAQGSQWRSVYVVNESRVFREDDGRWLYTALTRASERVTVAQ